MFLGTYQGVECFEIEFCFFVCSFTHDFQLCLRYSVRSPRSRVWLVDQANPCETRAYTLQSVDYLPPLLGLFQKFTLIPRGLIIVYSSLDNSPLRAPSRSTYFFLWLSVWRATLWSDCILEKLAFLGGWRRGREEFMTRNKLSTVKRQVWSACEYSQGAILVIWYFLKAFE